MDFHGVVRGYEGSFREAIEEAAIGVPPLTDWNGWQRWRASEGGLPGGPRGSAEQLPPSALLTLEARLAIRPRTPSISAIHSNPSEAGPQSPPPRSPPKNFPHNLSPSRESPGQPPQRVQLLEVPRSGLPAHRFRRSVHHQSVPQHVHSVQQPLRAKFKSRLDCRTLPRLGQPPGVHPVLQSQSNPIPSRVHLPSVALHHSLVPDRCQS